MKLSVRLIAVTSLWFISSPVQAQPSTLRVSDAVRLALGQHPSVKYSEALVEQSNARLRQVRAQWFPSLRVGSTLYQYQEPMAAWPIHGFNLQRIPPFDETLIQSGLQLEYSLFDGARIPKVRQAGRLRDAGGRSLEGTRQQLISRVVTAYLAVRTNEELVAANEQRRTSVDAERDRVEQLRGVGRAADVDVARAQAALANADAGLVKAQSALDVARRELARLISLPAESVFVAPVTPGPDQPLPVLDSLSREVLAHSNEVETARMRLLAAEAGRGAARGMRLPSLGLRGNWIDFRDGAGHRTDEWNASLVIGLPLFTGGAISGAVAEASAGHHAAYEDWRSVQDRVSAQLDQTLAARAESRARIESLQRAVASLEEVTRIEQLRLSTGADTQADYLRAEADLLDARAGLINARNAALSAEVELTRLRGRLDTTWVEQNLEHIP